MQVRYQAALRPVEAASIGAVLIESGLLLCAFASEEEPLFEIVNKGHGVLRPRECEHVFCDAHR
jgi:hypothetical protein